MRIAAIGCVVIALIVIGLALTINDPSNHAIYGARFWPVVLALGLIALNLPAALLPTPASPRADGAPPASRAGRFANIDWWAFLWPALLVLSYPLAVTVIGFPFASISLYTVLMFVLGQRGILFTLTIGTLFPLAMALFFTRVAYMPLPKGLGPFEDLTILLYRTIGAY